jgi:hypothetical protein
MKTIFSKIFSGLARNRKGKHPNRYFHEKFISRFSDIDSYRLLIRNTKHVSVETDKDITFSHHLTFGQHYKIFLKKLGKPNNCLTEEEPFSRKILYYKFMMGGHRTRCELHFYNNKLFFYCYTFPYLIEEDKKKIINILCEKYVDRPIDLEKFKIVDKNDNIIFINDIVDLTVNYIAANSELFTCLDPANPPVELREQKKLRIYQRELFRML